MQNEFYVIQIETDKKRDGEMFDDVTLASKTPFYVNNMLHMNGFESPELMTCDMFMMPQALESSLSA